MKISLVLILTGTLLTSLEILFGKVNLINLFANYIRLESNKNVYKLTHFLLNKGVLNQLFSRIGIVLIGIGTTMQYYSL